MGRGWERTASADTMVATKKYRKNKKKNGLFSESEGHRATTPAK